MGGMKSLLLLLSLSVTGLLAADVGLGFKAGFNAGSANTNVDVVEATKSQRATYHVGGLVDVGFGRRWSLQPQALYSGKGVTFHAPDHGHIISLYSLDIPINVVYKTKPGVFLGTGPNLGIHLRGTNEVTGDHPMTVDQAMTVDYKFGSEPGHFKRFDYGWNFLAGYQHPRGAFASINYLKGLRKNIINGPGAEWSHNVLSVSFGYTFQWKR
jgi:hypothetical protein